MRPALVIVFNHKFDNNIRKLSAIYGNRFRDIFFLVPFYTGTDPQVIAVYENSFYFQGHIAQAACRLKEGSFSHYLFIADDLLLNPQINEGNFHSFFGVEPGSSFFPYFISLDKVREFWSPAAEATRFTIPSPGLDIGSEMPTREEAVERLARHGITTGPVRLGGKYPCLRWPLSKQALLHDINLFLEMARDFLHKNVSRLSYPLTGGYSDSFVIAAPAMERFCHYCGTFAAANLFVEIAIPTAAALSCGRIVTEAQLPRKGKALWLASEKKDLFDRYDGDLDRLMRDFPSDALYIHPIKLSTWKTKGTLS